jgi:hypothetical protein
MKVVARLIVLLSLCTGANHAFAETIYEIKDGVIVFASTLVNYSGNYYDQDFTSLAAPIGPNKLENNVTGNDLTRYAWSPEYHLASGDGAAYLDLSFDQDIYNNEGADLVFFFAGNGTSFQDGHIEEYQFSFDIGIDGVDIISSGVTTSTSSDLYNDAFYASYAIIDLGDAYNGFDPLGDLRIYMDDSSMPALAAVGAYHTSPVVVPVPAAALLFVSGLPLFALFRRKRA